jgi:tetratricopeptide (TPR) repeat protein
LRKRLLDDIRRRVQAALDGDFTQLMAPEAATTVKQLLQMVPGPATADLDVAAAAGWFHWLRFSQVGPIKGEGDLNAAVELLAGVYESSPDQVPEPLPEMYHEYSSRTGRSWTDQAPDQWNERAGRLYNHYEKTHDLAALREATQLARRTVDATPHDDPDRAGYLSNLAGMLQATFEQTGDLNALIQAAHAGREAVRCLKAQHSARPLFLANIGAVLRSLFEQTGDLDALNQGVTFGREAAYTAAEDDPERAFCCSVFAQSLRTKFEYTGEQAAVVEAIRMWRLVLQLLPPDHPDRPLTVADLVSGLQASFEQTGNRKELDEAIWMGREALHLIPADHFRRPRLQANLAAGLKLLSSRTGEMGALNEAVELGRAAIAAVDPVDPSLVLMTSNLSVVLQALYLRSGDDEALAEALKHSRAAVVACPEGHPNRAAYLSNLSTCLMVMSRSTGGIETVTEAVTVGREAVELTPIGLPDRPDRLSNLASALLMLAERTENRATLADAVRTEREAIELTPANHPNRASRLSNLAAAVLAEYGETGELGSLHETVAVARASLDATAADDPERCRHLSTLGVCLRSLSAHTGDLSALTEAVRLGREAFHAADPADPGLGEYANSLGAALQELFDSTGDSVLLAEARTVYGAAANSASIPTVERVAGNRGVAWAAMTAGDAAGALTACEKAVALLPQIAPRRLARSDREHSIGGLAGLAAEAASAAVAADRPARAIELLEQARGILLAQAIEARSDLTLLRDHAPALATELERLRDSLDAIDHTGSQLLISVEMALNAGSASPTGKQRAEALRRNAEQRRLDSEAWEQLLVQIRGLPGFEGFMRPPPITELQQAAAEGPIVLVNVSRYRSDAVLLTGLPDQPIRSVPLPRLTRGQVIKQINRLAAARTAAQGLAGLVRGNAEAHAVLAWLWDEVTAVVLDNLGLGLRPTQEMLWPRVRWCPVGEMAYLPLHAAGHHNSADPSSGGPSTVMDRVISSYTPTIRVLQYARQDRSQSLAATLGAVIVAMPYTPDAPDAAPLPGAQEEADMLRELIPDSLAFIGAEATRDAVVRALPRHKIAHLACHGLTDWGTPAASRLLLYDHATTPLTVTELSRLHLPEAELAYLSACSTASTNQRLADEALHITSAFQLAGFRNVIGTLWPISDTVAADIARDFYFRLTDGGTAPPNVMSAAAALHQTIRQARRSEFGPYPTLWAAHVHAGI